MGLTSASSARLRYLTRTVPLSRLLTCRCVRMARLGAAVNAPLLAEVIYRFHAGHGFVESVGARPGEGAVGAFAFGRSRGVIESRRAAFPARFIAPAGWKRAVGLTLASQDASRSEAIRRWPQHAGLFSRVKDDGRAEAALIGVAGLARLARAAS